MNFDGAGDLEFGGGNVKVDPSVLKGKPQFHVPAKFGTFLPVLTRLLFPKSYLTDVL